MTDVQYVREKRKGRGSGKFSDGIIHKSENERIQRLQTKKEKSKRHSCDYVKIR